MTHTMTTGRQTRAFFSTFFPFFPVVTVATGCHRSSLLQKKQKRLLMSPSCSRPAQSAKCSRIGRKIFRTEGLLPPEANVNDHRSRVLARWSCRGALIAAALVSSCGFLQLGIHATSTAIARSLRRPRNVVQPRKFWTRPFAVTSFRLRGGGDSACDYRQDRLEKGQRALSRYPHFTASPTEVPVVLPYYVQPPRVLAHRDTPQRMGFGWQSFGWQRVAETAA
jgi:hypothetical protein